MPGGTFSLGTKPGGDFVFDNEKWAHPVGIAPFRIARAPVTNAAFAAFVDAGGYRDESYWEADGLTWLRASGAIASGLHSVRVRHHRGHRGDAADGRRLARCLVVGRGRLIRDGSRVV